MGHKSHDWCFYRTEEEEIGYRDMKEKTGKDGRLDVTSQGTARAIRNWKKQRNSFPCGLQRPYGPAHALSSPPRTIPFVLIPEVGVISMAVLGN